MPTIALPGFLDQLDHDLPVGTTQELVAQLRRKVCEAGFELAAPAARQHREPRATGGAVRGCRHRVI